MKNQSQNLFLWTPFIMAFGAALYFTLPTEVNFYFPATFALMAFIIAIIRHTPNAMRAVALFIFGFFYANAYTAFINTPQIARTMRDVQIHGTVENIDHTSNATRIYLRINANTINKNATGDAVVRLNIDPGTPINIGDAVNVGASLFRPAPAYAPETFDYARWAYFNKLSATGYATDIQVASRTHAHTINDIRHRIHNLANSFLTDALVLGYKNSLSTDERAIWTAAGIAHVWSISGFHMTLVMGWLFAIFYMICRAIPYITRRIPAKIPAMILAWVGLWIYLMMSGMSIATLRAFIMTSLIFMAFIMGRNALSMRNICIAFCILFLTNPHYVMQAGFQLSFSAVFGLVWFWGGRGYSPRSVIRKIGFAIYAAIATSAVAAIFTAPFVIAHFGAFPTYGLVGNLVLLPIFSFAIMPLTMIGTIGAIFGWHAPLNIANTIYEYVFLMAQKIAELPFANPTVPHIPNTAMMMFIMGLLCIILIRPMGIGARMIMRRINYVIGAAFICCGLIICAARPRPAVFVTYDHELIGFVDDGDIRFNKSRASNHFFAFDTWKQLAGIKTGTQNTRYKCARGVCRYHAQKFTVAYINKFVPLHREIVNLCRDKDTDYIISFFDIHAPHCENKILRGGFVIDAAGRIHPTPTRRIWHTGRI